MNTTHAEPRGDVAARGAGAATVSRLMVLFFSDIVGSTDYKNRLGTVEYAELLSRAQESGQIPNEPHARALAEMLFSLTMGAINTWVVDEDVDLAAELRSRAAVLIAGARGASATR